jgi:hypothetical protein
MTTLTTERALKCIVILSLSRSLKLCYQSSSRQPNPILKLDSSRSEDDSKPYHLSFALFFPRATQPELSGISSLSHSSGTVWDTSTRVLLQEFTAPCSTVAFSLMPAASRFGQSHPTIPKDVIVRANDECGHLIVETATGS